MASFSSWVSPSTCEMDLTSSLHILMPDPPVPNQPRRSGRARTRAHLEGLTARLVDHVAKHEWDHEDFELLVAPDYAAYLEYAEHPISRSLEEYLQNYREFAAANPDYAIDIISISADVNEKKGLASVWMHLRVFGHPTAVWRESVTVVYWKRKLGKWTCYKQNGVRGVGWYL